MPIYSVKRIATKRYGVYRDNVVMAGLDVVPTITLATAIATALTQEVAAATAPPPPITTRLRFEGVNLSGGEFSEVGKGTLGTDYTYPTNQEIDYFTAKGMSAFRVQFKAINLIDANRADDLAILAQLIDHAATRGASIILDDHSYGKTATGLLIGRDAGSIAEFAAQWSSIAAAFKDKPNVMFGLMNEPHLQSATEWLAGVNAAIQAIRGAGASQRIFVPGSYWSGAHDWVSSDNDTVIGSGVIDPLNNYTFEVHQYLDADNSGANTTVVTGKGATVLKPITDWARTKGVKLFLGELGFASDAASMAEGKALNDFTHKNADVWIGQSYWSAGPWWGNYFFSVEPTGLGTSNVIDKPQMSVLDDYLVPSN